MGSVKMGKLSYKSVLLCFALLCVGDVTGWAVAYKMAGPVASANFLLFSVAATIIIFMVQLLAFRAYQGSLMGQLVFRGAGGFSVVWFMLSLFLPVFWMQELNMATKVSLVAISVLLIIFNAIMGFRHFEKKWAEKKPPVEKFIDKKAATLDWCKITKTLNLSVRVYIPGVPRWMEPIVSILIIVSMIVGLNLRKVFPTFSVFAWGIPCVVVSSTIIQMIALNFAQAFKVVELEKKAGLRFCSSVE